MSGIGPAPWLQFLRPYASRVLPPRNAAYARFYDLARTSRTCSRCRTIATGKSVVANDPLAEDESLQNRSASIVSRIKELTDAKKLEYPRLRHESPAMRIPDFREKYATSLPVDADAEAFMGQDEVVLHGRLQSIRRMSSKLVFLDITQDFEQVQAQCSFGRLAGQGVDAKEFRELFRLLTRGDLVSIVGRATRTRTGELTLNATRLPRLLSPSLVPLPRKLVDEDTRMRYRHIDLLVNRQTSDTLRLRSYVIKYMRDFFHERDFLEFQTPILADIAGGAVARPFATRSNEIPSRDLALRIAPELWLKRLAVGGIEKIFEIGPAFRNEGLDHTHNPEFTMCEFYNTYANLEDLITLTEELIRGLARRCNDLISSKLVSLPPIDLGGYTGNFSRVEFISGLEQILELRLPDLEAENAFAELTSLLRSRDLIEPNYAPTSLPKLLDDLAGAFLEPRLGTGPVFLMHHPACMSPLAKSFTCPESGQLVSARTELFIGRRELANMYEEENDPFAQRRKFVAQAARRGGCAHPSALPDGTRRDVGDDDDAPTVVDESYIQALESGLPPTGGWGCGVERLVMLFSGARRISDCLSFGHLRNVVGLSSASKKY